MPFHAEAFLQRVEESVAAVERASQAELVVVVAPRSGSYADVDLRWALLAGLGALAVVLHSPWTFNPDMVLLDVVFFGFLAWLSSRRLDPLRRLLTSPSRRHEQVQHGAMQAFVEERVSATRERTGLLLYVSLLEREVAILPDLGLDGRVPRAEWNEVLHRLAGAGSPKELERRFFEGLEQLEQRLPLHAPTVGENPDEIPNAPRIRL
jgi:putative membrane protein